MINLRAGARRRRLAHVVPLALAAAWFATGLGLSVAITAPAAAVGTSAVGTAALAAVRTAAPEVLPAPTIVAPTTGASGLSSRPEVSGLGVPGDTVTVVEAHSVLCTARVGLDYTWQCVPTTPLTDGTHQLVATLSDDGGGESITSTNTTVTVGAGSGASLGHTGADVAPTPDRVGTPLAITAIAVFALVTGAFAFVRMRPRSRHPTAP